MVRKALALLVVVGVVGIALGGVGLLWPRLADATGHSATRSFSAASVPAGDDLIVTITISGDYGPGGAVVETLPDGFTYKFSSLPATTVAQGPNSNFPSLEEGDVLFGFLSGRENFTYTVTVSSDGGAYSFSGYMRDFEKDKRQVSGATAVMVVAATDTPMPSASRAISPATVTAKGSVMVTITASGYGASGSVEETPPSGFTYLSSSLDEASVTSSGQTVTFALPEEGETATSFRYIVTASDMAGPYDFSGELTDADGGTTMVGGMSSLTVEAAPVTEGPKGSRSFSAASVSEGGNLTVTVTAMDYGQIGAVVETMPAGFTYVSSTPGERRTRRHEADVRAAGAQRNRYLHRYGFQRCGSPYFLRRID